MKKKQQQLRRKMMNISVVLFLLYFYFLKNKKIFPQFINFYFIYSDNRMHNQYSKTNTQNEFITNIKLIRI